MKTFSNCLSKLPYRRSLAQIYLLHAPHQENSLRSVDVFLLLKRIMSVNGKPNCYRRIGLLKLMAEIIQGKRDLRREEF
jgi:hypothetical protein